jgi:hypothetical protein
MCGCIEGHMMEVLLVLLVEDILKVTLAVASTTPNVQRHMIFSRSLLLLPLLKHSFSIGVSDERPVVYHFSLLGTVGLA